MAIDMRVLHVPYCFYPDKAGGTEVYVDSLARAQAALGCQIAIAAPGDVEVEYHYKSVDVFRFPVSPVSDVRELYGDGDAVAAAAFGRILDTFHPDVVHLHALTRAVSVRLINQAIERRIRVVFHYHTPTVSCSRGILLEWGESVCDGVLAAGRCTACALHGHGLVRPAARLISSIPISAGRCIGEAGLTGGMWTALRMPELIELRIAAFHRMMAMVDHVVAPCEWVMKLLLRNRVASNKITLSRQGIS
jgi:hypothetical protein